MKVKLFGITREIVGDNHLMVPENQYIHTVGELKDWLFEQHPRLADLNSLAVAVDHTYAENHTELAVGQEVALIPPVSGG